MQWVMGGLSVAVGFVAAGAGFALAERLLQGARRSHQKTTTTFGTTLDGWDAWYVGGFSRLTMGLRGLAAVGVWLALTLAGAGFIGLGLRVAGR